MSLIGEDEPVRLLVIGAVPLREVNATGITLVNLVSGMAASNISQIYDFDEPPDPKVCSRHRRFSSVDIRLVALGKRIVGLFRASRPGWCSMNSPPASAREVGSGSPGLMAVLGDIAPFRLPDDIVKWAADFRPDLIYSPLGSVRMMEIVLQLSHRLSLPVLPHFMDDWPRTSYPNSLAFAIPRVVLNRKLRQVLARAEFGLTISDDMAEEFSWRYAKRFESFMNCTESRSIGERPHARANGGALRFGFVGGMHLNRWTSLLHVAGALQEISDAGEAVTLELYAPQKDLVRYGHMFEKYPVVVGMATLGADEVERKLQALDVLLHVESFHEVDSRQTRLSISTKVPQYMASGRPILAYGPETLSSVKYIQKSGAGLAVTSDYDRSAFADAARAMIRSSDLRERLGQAGRSVALENHDAVTERRRFAAALLRASRWVPR